MIKTASGFQYKGPEWNFERDCFDTLTNLKACDINQFPDRFETYCVESDKTYRLYKDGQEDPTTGLWQEIKMGASDDTTGGITSVILNGKENTPVDGKVNLGGTNNRAPAVTADFDTDISLPTTQKSWTFELFFSLDAGSYDIQILKGAPSSPLAGGVTLRKIGDLRINEFKHPFNTALDITTPSSSTIIKPINHLIVNTVYFESAKIFRIKVYLNCLVSVEKSIYDVNPEDIPYISRNGGMWIPNIYDVSNNRVAKIYCFRVYNEAKEITIQEPRAFYKQGRFWVSPESFEYQSITSFYKSLILDFTPQGIHGDVWKSNIAGNKYSLKLGNNPIFDHYEFLDDIYGYGEPYINTDKVLDGTRYTDIDDHSNMKVYTKQGSSWTPVGVGAGAGGSDSIEEVHDLMNSYGNLTAGKIYHADCGNNIYYPFIWTGGGNYSHECFHPLAPIRGWGAPDWSLNTYVLIPGLQYIDLNTTIVYVNQGLWSGDWQMKG